MTRETKAGIVVSCAFLGLAGFVLLEKYQEKNEAGDGSHGMMSHGTSAEVVRIVPDELVPICVEAFACQAAAAMQGGGPSPLASAITQTSGTVPPLPDPTPPLAIGSVPTPPTGGPPLAMGSLPPPPPAPSPAPTTPGTGGSVPTVSVEPTPAPTFPAVSPPASPTPAATALPGTAGSTIPPVVITPTPPGPVVPAVVPVTIPVVPAPAIIPATSPAAAPTPPPAPPGPAWGASPAPPVSSGPSPVSPADPDADKHSHLLPGPEPTTPRPGETAAPPSPTGFPPVTPLSPPAFPPVTPVRTDPQPPPSPGTPPGFALPPPSQSGIPAPSSSTSERVPTSPTGEPPAVRVTATQLTGPSSIAVAATGGTTTPGGSAPAPQTVAVTSDTRIRVQPGQTFESLANEKLGSATYAEAWRRYIAINDTTFRDQVVKDNQPVAGQYILLPTKEALDKMLNSGPGLINRTPVSPFAPAPAAPVLPAPLPVAPLSTGAPTPAAANPTYKVAAPGGERLYDIAQKVLGEGYKVGELETLNPQFAREDTNPLPAGTVLKMPPGTNVPLQNQ